MSEQAGLAQAGKGGSQSQDLEHQVQCADLLKWIQRVWDEQSGLVEIRMMTEGEVDLQIWVSTTLLDTASPMKKQFSLLLMTTSPS
jgi:hypothetical protein